MLELARFRFCPRCGSMEIEETSEKSMYCGECEYLFFLNTAAAVAGIIETAQGVILLKRAKNPSKGMLDLPGGFVDYGESFEKAIDREIREELGVSLQTRHYMGSFPNKYFFRGVTYHTSDAVFVCSIDETASLCISDEILEIEYATLPSLDMDRVAFESVKNCLSAFFSKT